MNQNKTGLTLGIFAVIAHLVWSALVMSGFGQTIYNGILRLHAIQAPIAIGPMSFTKMIVLLISAFIVGYVIGWVFSGIWNRFNR